MANPEPSRPRLPLWPARAVRGLLLAALLILSGCDARHPAEQFFPLAPGLSWQYRVTRTTMDGTAELRYAIAAVEPPSTGGEANAARETLGGQRYLYRVDDDGIYRLAAAQAADIEASPQLVLPGTLAPGTTWRAVGRTSVLENTGPPWETLFRIDVPVEMSYAIERDDAEIHTPAGVFTNCLEVVAHGRTNADVGNYIGRTEIKVVAREWYAPGVGLVRMERHETTAASAINAGSMTMTLDQWHDR